MKTRFFMVSEPWIRSSYFKFRYSTCNKNRGNQIPPTTIFPTIFFLKPIPTITNIHADKETSHPYVKILEFTNLSPVPSIFQECVSRKSRIPSNFLVSSEEIVKIWHLNTFPRAHTRHPKLRPVNHTPLSSFTLYHVLSHSPEVEEDINRHVVFIFGVQQNKNDVSFFITLQPTSRL